MRAVKIVGLTLAGLVALVVLLLVAVAVFVDPNDYKDRIATHGLRWRWDPRAWATPPASVQSPSPRCGAPRCA
jgi:hypothetical protein